MSAFRHSAVLAAHTLRSRCILNVSVSPSLDAEKRHTEYRSETLAPQNPDARGTVGKPEPLGEPELKREIERKGGTRGECTERQNAPLEWTGKCYPTGRDKRASRRRSAWKLSPARRLWNLRRGPQGVWAYSAPGRGEGKRVKARSRTCRVRLGPLANPAPVFRLGNRGNTPRAGSRSKISASEGRGIIVALLLAGF